MPVTSTHDFYNGAKDRVDSDSDSSRIAVLDQEVVISWPTPSELADALLTDKYSKATGFLKTDVGMCCLGVACAMADEISDDLPDGYMKNYFEIRSSTLSENVRPPWLSQSVYGGNQTDDRQEELINLNDASADHWSELDGLPVVEYLREIAEEDSAIEELRSRAAQLR